MIFTILILITFKVTFNITIGTSVLYWIANTGVTGILMPILAQFLYDKFIAPKK